ncbi:MAG: Do family serine endopeptidase [Pseudomonadota bacterium]
MKVFGRFGQSFAAMLVGGVAVGALTLGPQLSPSADANPISIEAPSGAPISFADLIEQVSPAVVSVNVRGEQQLDSNGSLDQFLERFRGMPDVDEFLRRRQEELDENGPPTRETRGQGSGFFISQDGFVVTNNHVIAGATEIQVVMNDGTEIDAELVGTDPETDLAVIKVQSDRDFQYVQFDAAADLRVGDWVVAVGNPFGLGGTATAGIVSALQRDIGGNRNPYTDFLQIDASINRGNSGGPTFNLEGEVIGVNTLILSPTGGSVGIGLAVPAELAIQVTNALMRDGRVSRGWLGVSIQDFTPEFAESLDLDDVQGGLVADVVRGGPAESAGIERGDVILEINGQKVYDATSVTRRVGGLIAGSENRFVVLRDGAREIVNVKVGERPSDPFATDTSSDGGDQSSLREGDEATLLGVSLKPIDDETRSALGLGDDESGLIVTQIARDSAFREVAIGEGDVILEVNGRAVQSVRDFRNAVQAARRSGKERVLVAVSSGGRTGFVTVEITEDE